MARRRGDGGSIDRSVVRKSGRVTGSSGAASAGRKVSIRYVWSRPGRVEKNREVAEQGVESRTEAHCVQGPVNVGAFYKV